MDISILLSIIVGFVVSAVAGKLLIPALRALKAGQSIKEIGPTWHMSKQGTPTMGGLMFILAIAVALAALSWGYWTYGWAACIPFCSPWCLAPSAFWTTI